MRCDMNFCMQWKTFINSWILQWLSPVVLSSSLHFQEFASNVFIFFLPLLTQISSENPAFPFLLHVFASLLSPQWSLFHPSFQNPKHGSWIRAVVTTTTCPVPSSTHARSSSCPILRIRAFGCGICPRGPESKPSVGTTIASGCWGLTQTSTCLLLVGGDAGLHMYTFYKDKGSLI